MKKRAVDLTLEELDALGANAALRAAKVAQETGLSVTGTVDFLENGQAISSLAQRHSSGAVMLLGDSGARTSADINKISGSSRRGPTD